MWSGPYGDFGSRKYLLASLDASLKRMGLDYVDIFYSHRPDLDTPLEETMGALAQAVRQGKALYVGLSNYPAERTREASKILKSMGVPCLIHQPRYNMFERELEEGLLDVCALEGIGVIAYMPLAHGLLSDRYLTYTPEEALAASKRAAHYSKALTADTITALKSLRDIAHARGQSLAQMAISWTLRDKRVTSSLIGASRPEHIKENIEAAKKTDFSAEELKRIDSILKLS
jgi:L-glyceraldehyde 3-phosphate reductase